MSILAAYSSTTAPTTEQTVFTAVILLAICAAPIAAWQLGIFRRKAIRGPVRLGGDRRLGPFLVASFAGAMIWILMQVIYMSARGAAYVRAHPGKTFDTTQLSYSDFAFLSTAPFVIGLVALIIADAAVEAGMARRIGYALNNLSRGLALAIPAMLIVLPTVWAASFVLDQYYRYIHFEHPAEHALLGAMKDAPVHIRAILIVGACAIAPVFEEFLFRGHLQTMLVRFLTPKPIHPQPVPVAAAVAETADAASALVVPPILDHGRPPAVDAPASPSAARRWLAVLITSLVFAAFHPLWMAPLIFVLSICLGYAYERTGNLWLTIGMHAIFNTCNTLIFLNFM